MGAQEWGVGRVREDEAQSSVQLCKQRVGTSLEGELRLLRVVGRQPEVGRTLIIHTVEDGLKM